MADFRFLAPLAVLVGLLWLVPAASATHVQCGDTITQDTKLDSDVTCVSGEEGQEITGLVIGASGITLDLNGHTVQVIPRFAEADEVNGIIDDGTPRSRLRILNGTITGFSQGIDLDTSGSLIKGVAARGTIGMILRGDGNTVTRSAPYGGYAALAIHGDRNVVRRNQVASYEGVGVGASGAGLRISQNVIRVTPAGFYPGIELNGFTDAVVDRNDVSSVNSQAIFVGQGAGATITRNVAHSSAYGIAVEGGASEVLLAGNTANRNYNSGIVVRSASTTITRNTANDNGSSWPDDSEGGLGIDALGGAVDGGGNKASGNGNPAQCIGVECR